MVTTASSVLLHQMSSSSPQHPTPPSSTTLPHIASDPLPSSFPQQHTNFHHIPPLPELPETTPQPVYPPPRNAFHTSSIPPISMPPPTHHSHLGNLPPALLPSHRDNPIPNHLVHRSLPPHDYSIPPGPITAPPPLPEDHVRLIRPPNYSESLLSRIAHLEQRVRNSPYLQEILTDMSHRTSHVASGVDIDGRIHFSGKSIHDNCVTSYKFPENDVDAEYCLEDTPGLSNDNFTVLKDTLTSHLHRCRRSAQEMVRDIETCLAPQISFRALPAVEMERRIQFIVNKFREARQQILNKFRVYVRNRRWIENVATRQRRGCLSHRQNNILRLWLFSNFNNPYPDNTDKKDLIAETALTITQINNWLINARSRTWKPTVEIMSGERIRKQMKKKEEDLANGKIRCWQISELSAVLAKDKKREKQQRNGSNHIPCENIHSVPINTAPGAQVAVQNTSLGAGPIANGMYGSTGEDVVNGSSSTVHDHGSNASQQVEGLADVGGNWLVPQNFATLEFNPDVSNQHAGRGCE